MRFRFIEDHRAVFMVRVMGAVLEVSASGYAAWRGRPASTRARGNRALVDAIRRVHADSRRRHGSPRVPAALGVAGRRVGRNRVARPMRRHGIHARCKRRFRATTDSKHALPLAPNLLARQFSAPAPNRAPRARAPAALQSDRPKADGWPTAPTCRPRQAGSTWPSCWTCLPARSLAGPCPKGWAMSESMPQDLTLAAWRMAITKRQPGPGLLHDADRGSQSAAHDDRRLLDGHGMLCSMSRNGKCWDNAPRESFFGSLKTELPVDRPFPTRQAARTALFRFIEGFYNHQRLHSAIGYVAPIRQEQLAAAASVVTPCPPNRGTVRRHRRVQLLATSAGRPRGSGRGRR
jgi:transposase InsO family protein